MVAETSRLFDSWNSLKDKPLWNNLQAFPFFSRISRRVALLDSLAGGPAGDFFQAKKVCCSMHLTGKEDYDFVFFIPVDKNKDAKLLDELMSAMLKAPSSVVEKRMFRDFSITEIREKNSKQTLSVITYRNYVITSYTAFLIEDVIRMIQEEKKSFASAGIAGIISGADESSDARVYINFKSLPPYLKTMSGANVSAYFDVLANFADFASLDLILHEKEMLLNGFTVSSSGDHKFMNVFRDQKPQAVRLRKYIPNNSGLVFYYGFDDTEKFNQSLQAYWNVLHKDLPEERKKINQEFGISIENDLGSLIGNEVALILPEIFNYDKNERIALIHVKEVNTWLSHLDRLAAKAIKEEILSDDEEDINESVPAVKTGYLGIDNFPMLLLGKTFEGFEQCYYASVDDYIILSNREQSLRQLLFDVESENVWSKSVRMNKFLDQTIGASNVSMFMNTSKAWKFLSDRAGADMKNYMRENAEALQKFGLLAIEFSGHEEKMLSNMVLAHQLWEQSSTKKENQAAVKAETLLDGPAISRMFPAKSAAGIHEEVIVQDSVHQVCLIARSGNILWKYDAEAPMTANVLAADLRKNGTNAFLFAVRNRIIALDVKGLLIENFPIVLPEGISIHHLSLLDYDNSKNFRILAADKTGDLYMFDAKGNNLDGWKPRNFDYRIAFAPFHIRVAGKDMICALQENGIMNITNRRAEMYKGFPLNLGEGCKNPAFVESGPSSEKSFMTVLTDKGELIRFNLNGQIVKRIQLPRPSSKAIFKLCIDNKRKSYVIMVQDRGKIEIFNPDQKLIFSEDFRAMEPVALQYFNFGSGKELFEFTIHEQGKIFLYNNSGILVQSIEGDKPLVLSYSEAKEEFLMYSLWRNRIRVTSFK